MKGSIRFFLGLVVTLGAVGYIEQLDSVLLNGIVSGRRSCSSRKAARGGGWHVLASPLEEGAREGESPVAGNIVPT